ncbi:hypothetical protein B9G69_001255 [Bdellovibrio sp. SKB1291214]|uniref:hypothetical protein n=1 Tax=Bdellovibrio sp. SKB1291214 TaxID=1732569 RepID=UPI000B51AD21|nr:hypothetical protein [Bdellovibrio sp. SKB1291214]UYL09203.1 hypothetical protein B9G69_001255 [Bdellovibrio sp. SKB1291214]
MPINNKPLVAVIIAFDLIFISIGLFLWLCWTAAASEQGAIALVFYAPVLFALTATAFFLGRYSVKSTSLGKIPKMTASILVLFYLTFYVSPFIGLGTFPNSIINGVASSFKFLTGKSPMEWSKPP